MSEPSPFDPDRVEPLHGSDEEAREYGRQLAMDSLLQRAFELRGDGARRPGERTLGLPLALGLLMALALATALVVTLRTRTGDPSRHDSLPASTPDLVHAGDATTAVHTGPPAPAEEQAPPAAEGTPTVDPTAWPPVGHDDDVSLLDSLGTSHRPACGEGWYTNDIARAQDLARERHCPLLLIFEKERCKHCRHFDNIQLADPEFAAILKSPGMVVVKRFYSPEDQKRFSIRATPTFMAMEWRDDAWVATEYLPGLLELPLMKKRIRDVAAGRGRLDRQRRALAADPDDAEALKTLLDEYLELFTPREKIDMVEKGLTLEPTWTHGVALKVFILNDLALHGTESARRMLEEFVGAAQERLAGGSGGARDYFTVGYYELSTAQYPQGVRNLERSIEIDGSDCEALSHLSFGYVAVAGQAKIAGDIDGAVESMRKADSTVDRALRTCPDSVLATSRKRYIESQWDAMELPRKR